MNLQNKNYTSEEKSTVTFSLSNRNFVWKVHTILLYTNTSGISHFLYQNYILWLSSEYPPPLLKFIESFHFKFVKFPIPGKANTGDLHLYFSALDKLSLVK